MSRSHRGSTTGVTPRRGRWMAAAEAACSLVLLVAFAGTATAKVEKTTVTLGMTATTPDPSCPGLPCQAIGSVTGFQVNNGQTVNPFLVTKDGTIKSWTLTLAQPTNSQRSFFNGFFGTPPQARLAILRRVPAPTRPATTCAARARSRSWAPTWGRRSSSAPT